MLISAALATTFAGALAVVVVAALGFGHRYGDAKVRLLEKTKTDELNDVRLAIRDGETIPILQNLWNFLNLTNQEMKKVNLELDVSSLKFDVERRERFNHLINDVFRSFKIEAGVKECWDELVQEYGDLGRTMYILSATVAIGGYSAIFLSLTGLLDSLALEVAVVVIIIVVICIILGVYGFSMLSKIGHNLKLYQDAIKKYLVEAPRVM